MIGPEDLLTISALARETGLDRRTLERNLLDVKPQNDGSGDRYRRIDVQRALEKKHVSPEKIARLLPFGGSATRLVAWQVLLRYLKVLSELVATEPGKPSGAELLVLATQTADVMLTEFGMEFPELAADDAHLLGFDPPAQNAAPGEFISALDDELSDDVKRFLGVAVAAARKR